MAAPNASCTFLIEHCSSALISVRNPPATFEFWLHQPKILLRVIPNNDVD